MQRGNNRGAEKSENKHRVVVVSPIDALHGYRQFATGTKFESVGVTLALMIECLLTAPGCAEHLQRR